MRGEDVGLADPTAISARFTTLTDVREILMHGEGRCSVRLSNQQQADLRLLPPQSFGAGLHYFTGSKAHVVAMRRLARSRRLKINEYGVFKGQRRLAGAREEAIFEQLPKVGFADEVWPGFLRHSAVEVFGL